MNSPEYGEQSSEETTKPLLIQRLEQERSAVGGTNEYITELIDMYDSSKEHHPNMLQLQRHAHFLADADTNRDNTSSNAFAFYKGEVLAYTVTHYLNGEKWPGAIYKILNQRLTASLRANPFEFAEETTQRGARQWAQAERLRRIADETIAELEEPESNTTPAALRNMIEEWAIESTDSPQEQFNMIMGFTYVLDSSVRIATSEASIRYEFTTIVEGEVEDIKYPKVESIDYVRDEIMDSFTKHYIAENLNGKEKGHKYELALDYLVLQMLRDFEKNPSLEFEDDIIVAGKVMIISEDESSETEGSIAETLAHDVKIEGRVGQVLVTDIPGDSLFTDPNTTEMNRYGVCLTLTNVLLISDDGTREFIPETTTFSVVLSYPGIVLRKYV